ncbi:MAG: hypothetical protein ACI4SX_00165 [Candidatus Fimenecus sp.]
MPEQKILSRLHTLGIPELQKIQSLNKLNGDYINLLCELPNGQNGKILDDNRIYFANQIDKTSDDRCYGVASDGKQLAVYEYGCDGKDAKLVVWLRL